jgi:hypothetical protein
MNALWERDHAAMTAPSYSLLGPDRLTDLEWFTSDETTCSLSPDLGYCCPCRMLA